MDKRSTIIVIVGTVIGCIILVLTILLTVAHFVPGLRKKTRIINRKQFSRRKVEEELQHNVRYAVPDSLSVSLAPVQPRSNRRQTLPAISLCRSLQYDSSSAANETTQYGSIELIRATVRRCSDVSFNKSHETDRVRKISLDSQILSKICEESSERYVQESRRGSVSSFLDGDSRSELDIDMYSSSDEVTNHCSTSGCGLGRLYFVVSYNKSLSNLYVTILKACYVRSSLIKETCCVYVKIALLPSLPHYPLYRTNCVTSMGNPMFNQTFTFHIDVAPEQLQLTVKEVRKLDSNRVIGYVWFDMTNLLKDKSVVTNSQEISREIFGENKLFRRRGDVLVDLKISINDSIEINVCVVEARNLMIRNQNASMFVRASILVNHKVQQSKKGQIIKRCNSMPIFNDRFRFVIPNSKDPRDLDLCCVMLCFCSRSRVRISRLIGRCIIGPMVYTEGDGLIQWTDAVTKPGTVVAQWLTLT